MIDRYLQINPDTSLVLLASSVSNSLAAARASHYTPVTFTGDSGANCGGRRSLSDLEADYHGTVLYTRRHPCNIHHCVRILV